MSNGPTDQEVATTLDQLVRHLQVREWEINLAKIEGLSTALIFLGVQSMGLAEIFLPSLPKRM
jgi:hypothetical protein